ncbi:hypothetical protein [Actinacidiphila bryophytorum]|uniref:hypothetical protein n=1 Tax=Actinacidiphila bryophytorum TaxID=1436133 RepID=UPI002176D448|nr:hypothetical protein [Actinacidiphila bryophytorum]UWE07558.1 hypothetical protein NYE86_01600 [Actinacidiphila bryophytorum]
MAWAGVFWGLAVLAVLAAWLDWSADRTEGKAVQAAVGTALVAAVSLFWALVLLRPRVELRGETVVIVNPLATYRLRRADVVAVTSGVHGAAVFHCRDGFTTRAIALGEASAGIGDERLSEVRAVLGLGGRRAER